MFVLMCFIFVLINDDDDDDDDDKYAILQGMQRPFRCREREITTVMLNAVEIR